VISNRPIWSEEKKAGRMSELAELERRITDALSRIDVGIARLMDGASQPASGALHEALEAERATNAQLAERLKALRARETRGEIPALEAKIAELTRQLDEQGLELHRMRKATIQLREALRAITEQTDGAADGSVINKAMLAELEALRAERSSEAQEMAELLAELMPIIEGEKADA
jgi:predicted RNase H-like nuclease (RuvC/YqgF family)